MMWATALAVPGLLLMLCCQPRIMARMAYTVIGNFPGFVATQFSEFVDEWVQLLWGSVVEPASDVSHCLYQEPAASDSPQSAHSHNPQSPSSAYTRFPTLPAPRPAFPALHLILAGCMGYILHLILAGCMG